MTAIILLVLGLILLCTFKTVRIFIGIVIFVMWWNWPAHSQDLLAPAKTQTQTRSFYNQNGSFAGSSVHRGNSGSFYNQNGSFDGSSVRHGNSTSYYDRNGHYVGSSVKR